MNATLKKKPPKVSSRKKAAAPKKTLRRTVKKAAENVQSNAERARELGQAMAKAGELLQQGAVFLELMAERAKTEPRSKKAKS
ncbi:MAG: hypothetical protein NVSMB31_20810 [Vulcanimicrobiaceae bacterium]